VAKDINIKVKTEGVDQAAAQIGHVTESVQGLNQAQRESFEASQLAEEKATGLTDAIDKMADASIQAGQDQKNFADYLNQTAQDAQDFKEYLDQAADRATNTGDAAQNAGQIAGQGFEVAAQKVSIFDRIVNGVQASAIRMVVGMLGIQAVLKVVNAVKEKLEEIQKIQKELADKSLDASKVGQSIEAATGTVGRQDVWTKKALALQGAGGLESIDAAAALMTGMQGATAGVGGIRNPVIAAMLQRLAPKLGASGKSGGDLSAIFEAAAKEGVGPEGLEAFISKGLGVSNAQAAAYMQSSLGRSRSGAAKSELGGFVAAASTVDWQTRLTGAEAELKHRVDTGEEKWLIPDAMEKIMIAFDSLKSEIDAAAGTTTDPARRAKLQALSDQLNITDPYQAKTPLLSKGAAIETEFKSMSINNDYSRNTYQMPVVGSNHFKRGARVDPNDI
jgi:hypothetical protein